MLPLPLYELRVSFSPRLSLSMSLSLSRLLLSGSSFQCTGGGKRNLVPGACALEKRAGTWLLGRHSTRRQFILNMHSADFIF